MSDDVRVPVGDEWTSILAKAENAVVDAEEALALAKAEGETAVRNATRELADAKDDVERNVAEAKDELNDALATLVRVRRACGLNADGTERKARARKAETTGGETDE